MDIRSAPSTPLRRGDDIVPTSVCLNLPTYKQTVVYCSVVLPGRRVRMGSAAVSSRNRPPPLSALSSPSVWSPSHFWLQPKSAAPPPLLGKGVRRISLFRPGAAVGFGPRPPARSSGRSPGPLQGRPGRAPPAHFRRKVPISASATPKHTEQHTGCWPRRNRPWYRTFRKRCLRACRIRTPLPVHEDTPPPSPSAT